MKGCQRHASGSWQREADIAWHQSGVARTQESKRKNADATRGSVRNKPAVALNQKSIQCMISRAHQLDCPRTIVSSASHASLSPTNACAFIFAIPKRLFSLISSTFMTRVSPGTTGRRKRHASTPPKKKESLDPPTSGVSNTRPPTCAIASTCSTPGIMGRVGKWPGKKLSLILLRGSRVSRFLQQNLKKVSCCAHRHIFNANSVLTRHVLNHAVYLLRRREKPLAGQQSRVTLASRNGKRCGSRFIISLISRTAGNATDSVAGLLPHDSTASARTATRSRPERRERTRRGETRAALHNMLKNSCPQNTVNKSRQQQDSTVMVRKLSLLGGRILLAFVIFCACDPGRAEKSLYPRCPIGPTSSHQDVLWAVVASP